MKSLIKSIELLLCPPFWCDQLLPVVRQFDSSQCSAAVSGALPGLTFFFTVPIAAQPSHALAMPSLSLLSPLSLSLSVSLVGRSRACWLSIKKLSLRVAQALSATICCQLVSAKEKRGKGEKKLKRKGKTVKTFSFELLSSAN